MVRVLCVIINKVESCSDKHYYNTACICFCLCWGLTSQSTIFQSYRDGATASWVINQYFRGVKCLAQGHNTAAVGTACNNCCYSIFSSSCAGKKNDSRALIIASGALSLTSVMVPSCDCSIVLPREVPWLWTWYSA